MDWDVEEKELRLEFVAETPQRLVAMRERTNCRVIPNIDSARQNLDLDTLFRKRGTAGSNAGIARPEHRSTIICN
jgi:hypothetical protein